MSIYTIPSVETVIEVLETVLGVEFMQGIYEDVSTCQVLTQDVETFNTFPRA